MNVRSTLFQIAAVVSAATACSASSHVDDVSSDGGGAPDGRGADGSSEAAAPACGGCNCGSPAVTEGHATPGQACAIAGETTTYLGGPACTAFCGGLNGGATSQSYFCTVPAEYTNAYQSAQPEAGARVDAGSSCPTWKDDVVVQCGYPCLGRRTEGIDDPVPCPASALGAVFANRAYLEAVSVHAFARLERELAFHRAPPSLLRKARRARRDEVRHTAMTIRLARRFGATASLPAAPSAFPVRSLFAIARENAVEGCVRETYGAVVGLVEASASSDADVRRASRSIATDECRHAELAMAVARWIESLLSDDERAAVRTAVAEAIDELQARGNGRIVQLLDARVWTSLLRAA